MVRSTRLAIVFVGVLSALSGTPAEASSITGAALNVNGETQECDERSATGDRVGCSFFGIFTNGPGPAPFATSASSWAEVAAGEVMAYAQFSTTGFYGTSPNVTAGAIATFTDQFVIAGGDGILFVTINSQSTGSFAADTTLFLEDGTFAIASATGFYDFKVQGLPLALQPQCVIEQPGSCSVTFQVAPSFAFTVFQQLGVNVSGSYRSFESGLLTVAGVSAEADFSHTGRITSIFVRDANGNLVDDAQVTSSSGLSYLVNPTTATAVPEPGSVSLVLLGSAVFAARRWRAKTRR